MIHEERLNKIERSIEQYWSKDEADIDLANFILSVADELIDEVRRLNEELRIHVQENKSLAVNNDLVRKDRDNIARTADFKTNQRYKQALERIKEKCKDGRAYTIEAEVYHIAYVELKGEEE